MAGLQQTPEEYYNDESLHGDYQYTTLSNIIDTFLLRYIGDDKLINNVKRYDVIGHAKRGLQELNYDALKEVKIIELELSDNLTLTLPHDYVNYVRISWVDENGMFRPIIESTDTGFAQSYLQDHKYEILFDDEGYPLEGTSTTSINQENVSAQNIISLSLSAETGEHYDYGHRQSPNYGMDTARANINGSFWIDKRNGKIKFSSDIPKRTIVLEYISDGLEWADPKDIKIHKLAEDALYMYIRYHILANKIYTQEYIVRRAKKDWITTRQNAKIRLANWKPHQLIQRLRGRNKWLK